MARQAYLARTIEDGAIRIINGNRKSEVQFPRINHIRNRLCALEVFKCLNSITPIVFKNYSKRNILARSTKGHNMHTRNNNNSVVIPRVRTETGRKTFSFQGAKIFNNLANSFHSFIFHFIIFIQVKGSYKYVFQPDLFKTKKEINTSSNKINLLTNIIYNI